MEVPQNGWVQGKSHKNGTVLPFTYHIIYHILPSTLDRLNLKKNGSSHLSWNRPAFFSSVTCQSSNMANAPTNWSLANSSNLWGDSPCKMLGYRRETPWILAGWILHVAHIRIYCGLKPRPLWITCEKDCCFAENYQPPILAYLILPYFTKYLILLISIHLSISLSVSLSPYFYYETKEQ